MIVTLLPCQFSQQYNRYPPNLSTMPFVVNSHDSAVYGGPQLSHQIQITHIKYKLFTSKTNCSHQIQITHIKYKILTSNTNFLHQIQIAHIKYKLLTSNANYSLQIQNPDIKNKIKRSAVAEWKLCPVFTRFWLVLTAILFLHVVLSSGCFAAPAEEMSTIATFVATAGKVS